MPGCGLNQMSVILSHGCFCPYCCGLLGVCSSVKSPLCRMQGAVHGISDLGVPGVLEPTMGISVVRPEPSLILHSDPPFPALPEELGKSLIPLFTSESFKWRIHFCIPFLMWLLFYLHIQSLVAQFSSGGFWTSCPSGLCRTGCWLVTIPSVAWAAPTHVAHCLQRGRWPPRIPPFLPLSVVCCSWHL